MGSSETLSKFQAFGLRFHPINRSLSISSHKKPSRAIVREAQEIDPALKQMEADLGVICGLFHQDMVKDLEKHGRRQPSYALEFWKL